MQVKLAKSYGFCFGVRRAIKLAENKPNGITLGPLIHNAKEINRLKDKFNVVVNEIFKRFPKMLKSSSALTELQKKTCKN